MLYVRMYVYIRVLFVGFVLCLFVGKGVVVGGLGLYTVCVGGGRGGLLGVTIPLAKHFWGRNWIVFGIKSSLHI